MGALSVPLLLCLIAVTYGFSETEIVGGRDAPVGMFPYQVSIRRRGVHLCGGSIINSRYILTAAQCAQGLGDIRNISINAGTVLFNGTGVSYEIDRVVVHRNYTVATNTNDIALIGVKRNILFNNLIKPIPLASGNYSYEGASCFLTGWGKLSLGGSNPRVLQYVNLTVENQWRCKQKFSNVINSHICTSSNYGKGACVGDTGSPLVSNGVQIGIASFGRPCAGGYPDVYTRVSSFDFWIKQQQFNMRKGEVDEPPADAIYIA